MKKISDLLERFAKLARASDEAKSAVMEALKKQGINISDMGKVSIKGSSVQLKLTASQKSEVFLKQNKLLAELAQNPLTKHITRVY